MFCKNCGEKLNDNATFCHKCGAKLKSNEVCNNADEFQKTKSAYTIKYNKFIVSVFDVQGDDVTLSQYTRTLNSKPKSVHEFKKKNILEIKFTRGVYPSILSKIRFYLSIIIFIVGILFFVVLPFAIVYGAFVFFFDTTRCLEIKLKSGQKIKVHYRSKSEAKYIVSELNNI